MRNAFQSSARDSSETSSITHKQTNTNTTKRGRAQKKRREINLEPDSPPPTLLLPTSHPCKPSSNVTLSDGTQIPIPTTEDLLCRVCQLRWSRWWTWKCELNDEDHYFVAATQRLRDSVIVTEGAQWMRDKFEKLPAWQGGRMKASSSSRLFQCGTVRSWNDVVVVQ